MINLKTISLQALAAAIEASDWGEVQVFDGSKTGIACLRFGEVVICLA